MRSTKIRVAITTLALFVEVVVGSPRLSQWACQPPHANQSFCNVTLPLSSRVSAVIEALKEGAPDGGVSSLINSIYAAPWGTGGNSNTGVPSSIWWNEATHGATNGQNYPTTFFPMPSLTACSFNVSLTRDIANVVGREGRAASNLGYGGFDYWAPNINLVRTGLWGRTQEVR